MLGSVRYAPDGERAEDALETGASMLAAAEAGWAAVSAAVVEAAVAGVRQCWAGGWHPADLARIVRREAAGTTLVALVVDAVAAEAARQPATRPAPDPRWAGQLRQLGAEVWWPADTGYLDALAGRRRASRFETAYDVLAALRALARLPRITPLPVPPPDGARSGPADAAAARALGRIRGLLAKAEATDYAEEAEALSAKAQELMARHSIDAALLDRADGSPDGRTDGPSAIRIGIEGPYEQAKALLLDAVAAANRCQAVWAADVGFSTVIGFVPDLEAAEMLYTSLLLQATAAMNRAGDALPGARKKQGGASGARGRSRRSRDFRQTFLVAYADRIRDRLAAATATATAAASAESGPAAPDLLPVLAARALAVERTTGALFPDTAPVRLRGVRDMDGWHQGRAAADRARLGEGASRG
ncbi:DUF2786 domain-containing protein [Streptomyces sp. NPDC058773]|uniref:DUF2786 domain-containing protein n=1 Tax=Streptomyces sp. NPDC058773 TaxID=3346632 RepID=UPI003683C1CA